uniref:Uncharacterized protein n=1 Tax=Arundo donax TaxID=35708 RepID=A0A0A9HEW7_ARUDO
MLYLIISFLWLKKISCNFRIFWIELQASTTNWNGNTDRGLLQRQYWLEDVWVAMPIDVAVLVRLLKMKRQDVILLL